MPKPGPVPLSQAEAAAAASAAATVSEAAPADEGAAPPAATESAPSDAPHIGRRVSKRLNKGKDSRDHFLESPQTQSHLKPGANPYKKRLATKAAKERYGETNIPPADAKPPSKPPAKPPANPPKPPAGGARSRKHIKAYKDHNARAAAFRQQKMQKKRVKEESGKAEQEQMKKIKSDADASITRMIEAVSPSTKPKSKSGKQEQSKKAAKVGKKGQGRRSDYNIHNDPMFDLNVDIPLLDMFEDDNRRNPENSIRAYAPSDHSDLLDKEGKPKRFRGDRENHPFKARLAHEVLGGKLHSLACILLPTL